MQSADNPLKVAVIGLTYDHAHGFLSQQRDRKDIQLVGIVEPNQEWAAYYINRYHLDPNILFSSFDALLSKTRVEAVTTFVGTFEHRRVVECVPPRGYM